VEKNDATMAKNKKTDAERMREFFPLDMRTSAFNFLENGSLTLKDDSVVINDPPGVTVIMA
jgi:hypothetical protein